MTSRPIRIIRSRPLRLLARVSSTTLVLAVASPAVAHEPDTWSMSLEELKEVGLGQYRGDPIPVPADAPLSKNPDDPLEVKQGVIYLNFEGATLKSGYDNSKTNTTQINNMVGTFAAYGDGSKRAATVQSVKEDWAAYNVVIVESRPTTGDYTMAMVGPTNPYGGGVLGIAPLDCNDNQTHNNIVYAFHRATDNFSASTQATTISQEVAHSYGLEHVNDSGNIMNPSNAGGNPSFKDVCTSINTGGNGIVCGSQHSAQCGTTNQQNSHKELLAIFGPANTTPDTTPPTVSITAPANGAVYQEGASFQISVNASDNQGVKQVVLYNNGSNAGTDTTQPYGWQVNSIPAGDYEFHVIASDLAGNQAMSNVVNIVVEAPNPGTTTGQDPTTGGDSTTGDPTAGEGETSSGGGSDSGDPSAGSGGDETSGGDPSGGTDGDPSGGENSSGNSGGDPTAGDSGDEPWGGDGEGGSLPPGFGQYPRGDAGCACSSGPGGATLAFGLLPLLAAVRRRRR